MVLVCASSLGAWLYLFLWLFELQYTVSYREIGRGCRDAMTPPSCEYMGQLCMHTIIIY